MTLRQLVVTLRTHPTPYRCTSEVNIDILTCIECTAPLTTQHPVIASHFISDPYSRLFEPLSIFESTFRENYQLFYEEIAARSYIIAQQYDDNKNNATVGFLPRSVTVVRIQFLAGGKYEQAMTAMLCGLRRVHLRKSRMACCS